MKVEACVEKLLRNLDPQLQRDVYVFCALPEERLQDLAGDCLCVFREREGLSAILPRNLAEREGLAWSGAFRQITLQLYTDLNAVGVTAAVTTELASWGIRASVVAALRHDHVFVPEDEAEKALRLMRGISSRAQYS